MSKMKTKTVKSAKTLKEKTKTIKKETKKTEKPKSIKTVKLDLKKKIKNDKLVKQHKNQLIQLQIQKQSLLNNFASVLENFNDIAVAVGQREDMLEQLPIETLQQLHNSTLPINPDISVTQFLDKRIDMRKELEDQDSQMREIEHQIALTQIDLIQAKIAVLISSLE